MAPHPPSHPDGSEQLGCTPFQKDPRRLNNGTACDFDVDAVRSLSYQNIMAAFNSVLLGTIVDPSIPSGLNSSIMKTVLADTTELAFIRDWQPHPVDGDFANLQTQLSNSSQSAYQGILAHSDVSKSRGSLGANLQELFQNFTLSLLSQPEFR